jgi:hypothetical protein
VEMVKKLLAILQHEGRRMYNIIPTIIDWDLGGKDTCGSTGMP